LFVPPVGSSATYDAVNNFSSCPDAPATYALDNCVMDKDLRAAIDKATLSYQTAVKALRDERLAGLDESIAAYKVHIQTSFTVMKESCVNTKPTEKTIRAEIEMIREGLRKNQELFDSKIDGIDAIAEVRADSNAKAEATYTKEMRSAETALRKVLKQ
jgi:hypothetical protein